MRNLIPYCLNKRVIFFLIATSSFLVFVFDSYAESKGRITSIDSAGYVYIDLGSKHGLEEGDSVDIYEGGTKILTLPVRAAYSDSAQLEPPQRRDLSKLRVDLIVIPAIKEEKAKSAEGKIISFDFQQGSGFIDLGDIAGIEEGMVFEVLEEDELICNLKVTLVFTKTSKFVLIDKKPPEIPLEDLPIRLKEEKRVSAGFGKQLWQTAKDKLYGQHKSVYSYYDIDKNKAKSFYRMGNNYREEIDLGYTDKLPNNLVTDTFFSGRWTDDKYIDTERFGIEELYSETKNDQFKARAGDVLGNFTPYSLLSSLKGAKAEVTETNNLGNSGFYGIFGVTKSRWEDFWSEVDSEPYTRYVGGLRLTQDFGKDLKMGLNFVSTDDDKDGEGPSSSTIPQDNKVASFDFQSELFNKKLKITSEMATSFTKLNESRANEHYKNDFAYNLTTSFDVGTWRFKNDYEKVGSNFRSLSGVAINNREEHGHRILYNPQKNYSLGVGWRRFHDNLKKLGTYTTFTDVYDGNFSIAPLSESPDFNIDLGYYKRKRTSSSTSIDDSTATYSVDLSNITGDYTYGLGYSVIRKVDVPTYSNSRHKDIWNTFVRSNYQFQNIRFLPAISYSIERDKQRSTRYIDTYQVLNYGFSLFSGKYTSMNFNHSLYSADYQVSGADLLRNTFTFNVKQSLFKSSDKILEISVKKDDFNREVSGDSFIDNIFNISYIQKF